MTANISRRHASRRSLVAATICAATVFVKQHSILDVFAALALSLVLYLVIYVAARRGVDRRHAPPRRDVAEIM